MLLTDGRGARANRDTKKIETQGEKEKFKNIALIIYKMKRRTKSPQQQMKTYWDNVKRYNNKTRL